MAVVLMAEDRPPMAPKPVIDEHKTSIAKCPEERVAPAATPSSKMYFIPAYPARQQTKAPMSGTRGPCASTMRPTIGPAMYVPATYINIRLILDWRDYIPLAASPTILSWVCVK